MCMQTADVVINMYTILSQLIDVKGTIMRHFACMKTTRPIVKFLPMFMVLNITLTSQDFCLGGATRPMPPGTCCVISRSRPDSVGGGSSRNFP